MKFFHIYNYFNLYILNKIYLHFEILYFFRNNQYLNMEKKKYMLSIKRRVKFSKYYFNILFKLLARLLSIISNDYRYQKSLIATF